VHIQAYLRLSTYPSDYGVDWDKPVRLYRALNNGFLEEVGIGEKRRLPTAAYPAPGYRDPAMIVWEFNNIVVSATLEPGNHYSFLIKADGLEIFPTVWINGAEGQTIMPNPDVPAISGANCVAGRQRPSARIF